ncbi:MAG: LLM class flavin-dependent oxidoreductase [Verrucomicrobium sp.]|nr:LLM class flavin-dependent oxidoreductase [Verrucomicrobium sp.]
MSSLADLPFSVLDLSPVVQGSYPGEALQRSADLARHAESWGYKRYWVAEHHNMPGIASAATSVVIGHLAGATKTIRVGSGGIMLGNHAPLVIAEQFGTLESLYPGRIDLGLGRAPGTDQVTMRALRQNHGSSGESFPEELEVLRSFLRPILPGQKVRAVPGAGLDIPIWLLGSSGFSAQLAGQLGLPFGSAGHFSPDNVLPALELYRRNFRPSAVLQKPYALVCVNIFAADTPEEAEKLATSQYQAHVHLARGMPMQLPPPLENREEVDLVMGSLHNNPFLRGSIIGNSAMVRDRLQEFVEETQADEIMVHSMIYDHAARLHSYEIVKDLRK